MAKRAQEAKVPVPAEDDEKEKEKDAEQKRLEELEKESRKEKGGGGAASDSDDEDDDELSQEDRELKENLEMLVDRVIGKSQATTAGLRQQALIELKEVIRTSTSSMTSVPKPLKFLRPHYDSLKACWEGLPSHSDNKPLVADILSVLAMTMADEGSRECLRFKLAGDEEANPGEWGQNYVSHLAGEIGEEYQERSLKSEPTAELMGLVHVIVPFDVSHNAESEAVDLLIEVESLHSIQKYVTEDNYRSICEYIASCADYAADLEERSRMLRIVHACYMAQKNLAQALRYALKVRDRRLVLSTFRAAEGDESLQKQLAFMLGQQHVFFHEFEDEEELAAIMGNNHLAAQFKNLARELDVQEAKLPEDIYKSHLAEGGPTVRKAGSARTNVSSAKQNLAATFCNAFVNAGFGQDKLVTPQGADWIHRNKDHGIFSAAASVGAVLLWDVETGFSDLDKYSFSDQLQVKAGALLGTALVGCGVRSEMDAALYLLSEHVESNDRAMKLAAVLGLGLAYAGTNSQEVRELLVPLLVDAEQPMEIASHAALALGMVFVGSQDGGTSQGGKEEEVEEEEEEEEEEDEDDDLTAVILEVLMERSETDLNDSVARLMFVGLGLFFLGRGEVCEPTLLALDVLEHEHIKKYVKLTVETSAYYGTGSVLTIQKLLGVVGEHIEDEKMSMHQAVAVLGIAMVSSGEKLAAQMALRSLDHVLQYGELAVRRAVPLALGLLSISAPDLNVMDSISKLTHDSDQEVSQNACLALGLLGAGTNNSRIANLLRNLAVYYSKEPSHLFLVRVAQGLLHLGKGLMTLSPFHSDSLLLSHVSAAGLLAFLHTALDLKNSVLSKRHYMLYSIMTAVRPRMLYTVDEDLEPVTVKVRVGQAVDTVGQAGKNRKTITGFQTHTTPVLLAHNERAELVSDEYTPLSDVLEGVVIVKKNPNYVDE